MNIRRKKFETLPSAGKVLCTVFWDTKGLVLQDSFETGQTINSDSYIAMVTKVKARIPRVRLEKSTTFLLQHDNARLHTSLKTVQDMSNLAGLSYHTHRIARIWRLLASICSGR